MPILVHKASITEQHLMENAAHAAGLKGLQQNAYGSVADAASSVRCPLSPRHPTMLPTRQCRALAVLSHHAEVELRQTSHPNRSETQVYIEGLVDDLAAQHSGAALLTAEKTKRGATVLKFSPASGPPTGA